MKHTLNNLPERPLHPPEGTEPEKMSDEHCQECNEHLKGMYGVVYCTEHLTGQELIDYAAKLSDCRDQLVRENRELTLLKEELITMVQEERSKVEALKGANRELIDHSNRLIFEGLGDK